MKRKSWNESQHKTYTPAKSDKSYIAFLERIENIVWTCWSSDVFLFRKPSRICFILHFTFPSMAFIDLLVYIKSHVKSIYTKYLSGINIHSLHALYVWVFKDDLFSVVCYIKQVDYVCICALRPETTVYLNGSIDVV